MKKYKVVGCMLLISNFSLYSGNSLIERVMVKTSVLTAGLSTGYFAGEEIFRTGLSTREDTLSYRSLGMGIAGVGVAYSLFEGNPLDKIYLVLGVNAAFFAYDNPSSFEQENRSKDTPMVFDDVNPATKFFAGLLAGTAVVHGMGCSAESTVATIAAVALARASVSKKRTSTLPSEEDQLIALVALRGLARLAN